MIIEMVARKGLIEKEIFKQRTEGYETRAMQIHGGGRGGEAEEHCSRDSKGPGGNSLPNMSNEERGGPGAGTEGGRGREVDNEVREGSGSQTVCAEAWGHYFTLSSEGDEETLEL